MIKIVADTADYLYKTLGLSVKIHRWGGSSGLPFFFQDRYEVYVMQILKRELLLVLPAEDETITPATLKKDLETARKIFHDEAVFVTGNLVSYDRKRLIDQKVSFIVPNNQLYLPELGIDLREHFRKIRSGKKLFSPSTQVIILNAIIKKNTGPYTPARLAEAFGYSSMTMTRAFDEIEAVGIGNVRSYGRERVLEFQEDIIMLWKESLPYLRSPVRKTVWLKSARNTSLDRLCDAGLTALSQYSMLAGPAQVTGAIDSTGWKHLMHSKDLEIVPFRDDDALEIQVWSYAPELLSADTMVDPFSLYLSLSQEDDERIQKALDEMMEGIRW